MKAKVISSGCEPINGDLALSLDEPGIDPGIPQRGYRYREKLNHKYDCPSLKYAEKPKYIQHPRIRCLESHRRGINYLQL